MGYHHYPEIVEKTIAKKLKALLSRVKLYPCSKNSQANLFAKLRLLRVTLNRKILHLIKFSQKIQDTPNTFSNKTRHADFIE